MSARASRTQVQKYFPMCPFCSEKSVEIQHDRTNRDLALCNVCGALWHIYVSQLTFEMRWAELIQIGAKDGAELLGIQHKPEFWRDMALKKSWTKKKMETDTTNKTAVTANHTTIREITKEKEVIVKIRCSYCHKTYDETSDKCPYCGGSN